MQQLHIKKTTKRNDRERHHISGREDSTLQKDQSSPKMFHYNTNKIIIVSIVSPYVHLT